MKTHLQQHILFIPSWYYDVNGRGAGIFFKEQFEAIQKFDQRRKYSVLYCAFDLHHYLPQQKQYHENGLDYTKANGFQLPKRFEIFKKGWLKKWLRFYKDHTSKYGTPHLIHAHSIYAGLVAKEINELYGVPYVISLHLTSFLNDTVPVWQQSFIPTIFSKAEKIIAVSNGLMKSIRPYSEEADKKICIPNLFNSDIFYPKDNPPKDGIHFCSIGDPWHKKGLDIILMALSKLDDRMQQKVELSLADKIPGRKNLLKLAKELHLKTKVNYVGQINRQEVAQLIRSSHACLSASRVESFGLTMIESMACGRPVIATRTAGALDIVNDTNGILVAKEDPVALADAIEWFIAERQYQFDAQAIASYATENYSAAVVVKRILGIYDAILSQNA